MEIMVKLIKVKDETHKELSKLGGYGDTMDDIIQRLIQYWNSSHEVRVSGQG